MSLVELRDTILRMEKAMRRRERLYGLTDPVRLAMEREVRRLRLRIWDYPIETPF